MRGDKVVHFVCFETGLDSEGFIAQWEQFTRPANTIQEVTLQQSEKNGLFKYIAQYRCIAGEFDFVFSRARRSPFSSVTPIRIEQSGGYSILQFQRMNDAKPDESKVFAFLINSNADLSVYNKMLPSCKLNIYEAYYENCRYTYILEFFIKSELTAELLQQLKQHGVTEIRAYKECIIETS
ncbi:MAG: hypothetical protein ACHQF0_00505 [Chitinophagales bacterium]